VGRGPKRVQRKDTASVPEQGDDPAVTIVDGVRELVDEARGRIVSEALVDRGEHLGVVLGPPRVVDRPTQLRGS
jgi:hypothetical protein